MRTLHWLTVPIILTQPCPYLCMILTLTNKNFFGGRGGSSNSLSSVAVGNYEVRGTIGSRIKRSILFFPHRQCQVTHIWSTSTACMDKVQLPWYSKNHAILELIHLLVEAKDCTMLYANIVGLLDKEESLMFVVCWEILRISIWEKYSNILNVLSSPFLFWCAVRIVMFHSVLTMATQWWYLLPSWHEEKNWSNLTVSLNF